jgi:hypothetical protein
VHTEYLPSVPYMYIFMYIHKCSTSLPVKKDILVHTGHSGPWGSRLSAQLIPQVPLTQTNQALCYPPPYEPTTGSSKYLPTLEIQQTKPKLASLVW